MWDWSWSRQCRLLILSLLLPLSAIAQQRGSITGVVRDLGGNPLSDVSVSLLQSPQTPRVIAYTLTDERGRYTLKYLPGRDSLTISIGGFNISPQLKQVPNDTEALDFVVDTKPFDLHEVVIKADKISLQGDTLNYFVGSFTQPNDHTIEDVLKRMPGIEVMDGGQIRYKGKAVKGVLIEGLDLMKNRYGIATQSLSADDIASVQVFENHQEIKALRDLEFIDQATINLKLKEGSKGVLGLSALASAGWRDGFVGHEELIMTYFARKHQHLGTLKWNNAGLDLGEQLLSFGSATEAQGGEMTMMIRPAPPSIDRAKYLFNNDLTATLNNVFITPGDHQLSLNLHYLRGSEDRSGRSVNTIFLPDRESLTIEEQLSSHDTRNRLGGEIGYKVNDDRFYLNDELTYSGVIDQGNGVASQVDGVVNQSRSDRRHSANNRLELIYRSRGGRGIRLISNTDLTHRSEQLRISPEGVEIFGSSSFKPLQTTTFTSISTYNSLHLLHAIKWRDLSFNPYLFANYKADRLTSDLKLFGLNNLTNQLQLTDTRIGAALETVYNGRQLRASLNIPIGIELLLLNDEINKERTPIRDLLFTPSFSLNWKLTSRWNTTLTSRYSESYNDISTLYSGRILTSYRSLEAYNPQVDKSRSLSVLLGTGYRWVQRMFFASAALSYSRHQSRHLYSREYDGNLLKTSSVVMPNVQQLLNYKLYLSKGFDWKNLNISIEGGQFISKSPYLVQKQFAYLRFLQSSASVKMSIEPTSQLLLEYDTDFRSSRSLSQEGKELLLWTNEVGCAVEVMSDLHLRAGLYHQYNNQGSHPQNTFLLDASLSYRMKGGHLSLEWNNILNTRHFSHRVLSSERLFESQYRIHPASIMLTCRFKIL